MERDRGGCLGREGRARARTLVMGTSTASAIENVVSATNQLNRQAAAATRML